MKILIKIYKMKKSFKIFLLSFVAIIFVFSFASVVFGASTNIACDEYKYPWCDAKDLEGKSGLINTIYNYSLVLVGIVALGAIIYGGILYTMSAGNPSGQTEATGWITGAIWGLILLLGAALLFNTINPEIISLKLPNLMPVKIKTPTSTSQTTTGEYVKNSGKNCINSDKEICKLVWDGNSNECVCSQRPITSEEQKCIDSGKKWRLNVDPTRGGQCY